MTLPAKPPAKTLGILPGCARHEHANWHIGPVGHSRDSSPEEESNWQVTLAAFDSVDPDHKHHEVHKFGHWACGWIEEVAYDPGANIASLAAELRERLESYPILDERHLAYLELESD